MNRLDRLHSILIHLQSKKVVTAQELAERFQVSIRTVYRDIRSLEESGVPVGAEAGIGYFLADNYHLPPIMFSNAEASALMFGAKFIENLSDNNLRTAYESALFKIKSVLRSDEKEYVDVLHKFIEVYSATGISIPSNLFLSEIQKALVENMKIEISYLAAYSGELSERTLVPITLCFYAMQWHLIAYCELRNCYRDFRLDRIKSLKISLDYFDRKQYKTAKQYFDNLKNIDEMEKIVISMFLSDSLKIAEYKYWYGFTHQYEVDECVEMTFLNNDIDGFARWIIYSGIKLTMLPKNLKEAISNQIQKLNAIYLDI
jgi:predicted DNA-binding transcriptional regulator YafY